MRDQWDIVTIAIYEHFRAASIGPQENCLVVNLLVRQARASLDSLQKLRRGLHSAIEDPSSNGYGERTVFVMPSVKRSNSTFPWELSHSGQRVKISRRADECASAFT